MIAASLLLPEHMATDCPIAFQETTEPLTLYSNSGILPLFIYIGVFFPLPTHSQASVLWKRVTERRNTSPLLAQLLKPLDFQLWEFQSWQCFGQGYDVMQTRNVSAKRGWKSQREWHCGKCWHSEEMNDIQEERTFKDGGLGTRGRMGGLGGWRDVGWCEDGGRWLVWSEPRAYLATSLRCFTDIDVDETLASPASLLSQPR